MTKPPQSRPFFGNAKMRLALEWAQNDLFEWMKENTSYAIMGGSFKDPFHIYLLKMLYSIIAMSAVMIFLAFLFLIGWFAPIVLLGCGMYAPGITVFCVWGLTALTYNYLYMREEAKQKEKANGPSGRYY